MLSLVIILVSWLMMFAGVAMALMAYRERQRETDRYELTELAERAIEDPLELMYELEGNTPNAVVELSERRAA